MKSARRQVTSGVGPRRVRARRLARCAVRRDRRVRGRVRIALPCRHGVDQAVVTGSTDTVAAFVRRYPLLARRRRRAPSVDRAADSLVLLGHLASRSVRLPSQHPEPDHAGTQCAAHQQQHRLPPGRSAADQQPDRLPLGPTTRPPPGRTARSPLARTGSPPLARTATAEFVHRDHLEASFVASRIGNPDPDIQTRRSAQQHTLGQVVARSSGEPTAGAAGTTRP